MLVNCEIMIPADRGHRQTDYADELRRVIFNQIDSGACWLEHVSLLIIYGLLATRDIFSELSDLFSPWGNRYRNCV